MSEPEHRLSEIVLSLIRKLRSPSPELFPTIGILSFISAVWALSRTSLMEPLMAAMEHPFPTLLFAALIVILAVLYGFASFIELGIGRQFWPEFMPEPALFHVFLTISFSGFFALLCFLSPQPKLATVVYCMYCIFDWFGNFEYRQMVRRKISAKSSSRSKKYQTVAFRGTRTYFFERPMDIPAGLKLLMSMVSVWGAWNWARPEYSYFPLSLAILANELVFWYWRLSFAKVNGYWFRNAGD